MSRLVKPDCPGIPRSFFPPDSHRLKARPCSLAVGDDAVPLFFVRAQILVVIGRLGSDLQAIIV
jgi:hypothetical protein